MVYTFLGNKDFIKKELDSILKDYKNEQISNYDLDNNDSSFNDVILDLNTYSLFDKKIVLVYNFDKIDNNDLLVSYLENPSDNTLVLISYKELDKRKKISKIIKDKTKIKELFDYDVNTYIKSNLDDYKIDFMAQNLLISYTNSNINRIEKELEKLKMYKLEDKNITEEDVKKLVKKSYDSTIFNLIDYINNKDLDRILKTYNELKMEGETSEQIMYTIANHYRLLFQIKNIINEKSDNEIISLYGMHPYRLKKLKEQSYLITNEDITNMLKTLGDIDIKVKTTRCDIDSMILVFFKSLI